MVDDLFYLSLRILWLLYNTSLCTIDTLALISNNVLKVYTLDFLFSYVVSGLIWEFVDFLPRRFGGKITPKAIGDKSVAMKYCSLI